MTSDRSGGTAAARGAFEAAIEAHDEEAEAELVEAARPRVKKALPSRS